MYNFGGFWRKKTPNFDIKNEEAALSPEWWSIDLRSMIVILSFKELFPNSIHMVINLQSEGNNKLKLVALWRSARRILYLEE